MGVNPKIGGKPSNMDGLFHGKPELKNGTIWGGENHLFLDLHPYVFGRCFPSASKSQASRKSKLLNASIWIPTVDG